MGDLTRADRAGGPPALSAKSVINTKLRQGRVHAEAACEAAIAVALVPPALHPNTDSGHSGRTEGSFDQIRCLTDSRK